MIDSDTGLRPVRAYVQTFKLQSVPVPGTPGDETHYNKPHTKTKTNAK